MTLGSLFDGIGTWQLAARNVGIKPVWSSEIEKFPLEVTARHFPETIQLGDINAIENIPPVDIVTAGSPCQDISIAGRQRGIHGERSCLFFKAVELVGRSHAQFFVWENVPNVLNIRGGQDFAAVLSEITATDIPIPEHGFANAGVVDFRGGQLAWRILDAQYWGVAQRRKRIFIVTDFGSRRAAKILFEPACLRRNSATGTSEKTNVASGIASRVDYAVYDMTHVDEVIRPVHGDKANCLNARMGTGGNQVQLIAYGIGRAAFNQGFNSQFKPNITEEISTPLTARGPAAVGTKDFVRRLTPVECERLMGLPDNLTAGGSDSVRYKALGNAMALPIAEWILKRIKAVTS